PPGLPREPPSAAGTHRDRVVPERASRCPCRGLGVARGRMAHHVFQRDLQTPLAFEVIDPSYGAQGAGHVACDRVEHVEFLAEALIAGRSLHVEDADDLVAGAQRHDHGLAGLRIAAMETVVVHGAQKDYPLAPARDPSGDSLIDALLMAKGYADPYRCAHP